MRNTLRLAALVVAVLALCCLLPQRTAANNFCAKVAAAVGGGIPVACAPSGYFSPTTGSLAIGSTAAQLAPTQQNTDICPDDTSISTTALVVGVNNTNYQPQVGLINYATGSVTTSLTNLTSPQALAGNNSHDAVACASLGNGYWMIIYGGYTAAASGTRTNAMKCMNDGTGGAGSTDGCMAVRIGNSPAAIEGATDFFLPGALSEPHIIRYGTTIIITGQTQEARSFGVMGHGNEYIECHEYTPFNSADPFYCDTGTPGGSLTTYDPFTSAITNAQGGEQMIGFSPQDDAYFDVPITAITNTSGQTFNFTANGCGPMVVTTTGTSTNQAAIDAAARWNTFCGTATYTAVHVTNTSHTGCPAATGCVGFLLNSGDPAALSAPAANSCTVGTATSITCGANHIDGVWTQPGHTHFCLTNALRVGTHYLLYVCEQNASSVDYTGTIGNNNGSHWVLLKLDMDKIGFKCDGTILAGNNPWTDVAGNNCIDVNPTKISTTASRYMGSGVGLTCSSHTLGSCTQSGVAACCPYTIPPPTSYDDTNICPFFYNYSTNSQHTTTRATSEFYSAALDNTGELFLAWFEDPDCAGTPKSTWEFMRINTNTGVTDEVGRIFTAATSGQQGNVALAYTSSGTLTAYMSTQGGNHMSAAACGSQNAGFCLFKSTWNGSSWGAAVNIANPSGSNTSNLATDSFVMTDDYDTMLLLNYLLNPTCTAGSCSVGAWV